MSAELVHGIAWRVGCRGSGTACEGERVVHKYERRCVLSPIHARQLSHMLPISVLPYSFPVTFPPHASHSHAFPPSQLRPHLPSALAARAQRAWIRCMRGAWRVARGASCGTVWGGGGERVESKRQGGRGRGVLVFGSGCGRKGGGVARLPFPHFVGACMIHPARPKGTRRGTVRFLSGLKLPSFSTRPCDPKKV